MIIMVESERYDWDLNGIWDYGNDELDDYIESFKDIAEVLNRQDAEIKKYKEVGQEIYEWDSKRNLYILQVMQDFACKYSQDSLEYNLLYELGKKLPINPNNLWPKKPLRMRKMWNE